MVNGKKIGVLKIQKKTMIDLAFVLFFSEAAIRAFVSTIPVSYTHLITTLCIRTTTGGEKKISSPVEKWLRLSSNIVLEPIQNG